MYNIHGRDSHQKSGDCSADEKAGDDIRPVVAVFSHAVQAGEKRQTHEPQRQHRLGQTSALCLHCARHIHLQREDRGGFFFLNMDHLFTERTIRKTESLSLSIKMCHSVLLVVISLLWLLEAK